MSFVGIDISKSTLEWALVATAEGDVLAEGSVANTEAGSRQLVTRLPAYEPTLIVIEATGAYHRPVLSALVGADLPVTLVNPLQIVGFRQVRLGRAKTDRQDARLLARFGATYATELQTYAVPSRLQAQIRAWVRYRETLVREQTRLAGQREANHWQGDAQVGQWLADDKQTVDAKLAVVDAALANVRNQIPEAAVVLAIKGVGPVVTAAVLGALPVALWGDAKKASAYFGLVPKLNQSGRRSQSRMSKAGPGDVRRVLWLAARSAIDHDPAIRAWYDGLLARGKTKQLAHCAVMNTLVRHMMGRLKAWQTDQLAAAAA
jgi:transposase